MQLEPLRLLDVPCCICGVDDAEPVAVGEDFEYRTSPDSFQAVRCNRCRLVYLDPRPHQDEFDRIYPPSYHAFDFSADGTVQELERTGRSYHLAIMIQTIEHVDDPAAVLSSIRSLLTPGGRLVVVTDNVETLDFRLFGGRHWGGYHFPRHWNLFSKKTLTRLAGNVGLEVEQMATILSPVNWVYSVRNALVDYNAPSWIVNRFSLSSPGSLAVFTALDALFQATGRGALLRAYLRRPQ